MTNPASKNGQAEPARTRPIPPQTIPPGQQGAPEELDPRTRAFYLHAMDILDTAGVPYLVGGAYALAYHAGIVRHTKDLDLFIPPQHLDRALQLMEEAGYRTGRVFPHWLAKVFWEDAFVDIIFGSGNGLSPVDQDWFVHAVEGEALGRRAKLCPAEETVWSKAFIQERERFDGADVNHIILSRGRTLDWARLLRRFRGMERVLLGHLMFFGFAFPADRSRVPDWVLSDLWQKVQSSPPVTEKICMGTFLSRQQYLVDLRERGYLDGRVEPRGPLAAGEVAHWTAAIGTIR